MINVPEFVPESVPEEKKSFRNREIEIYPRLAGQNQNEKNRPN